MTKIQQFITKENNLLVIIDSSHIYEFRDLTPRDLLWLEHQKVGSSLFDKPLETIDILYRLMERLLVRNTHVLENEPWSVFIEINKIMQEQIYADRVSWDTLLAMMFAAGNKSIMPLQIVLDLPLTISHDIAHIVNEFYTKQQEMLDEAQGVIRK